MGRPSQTPSPDFFRGSPNAPSTHSGSVACSICLDAVVEAGDRSIAKLQCGHQFHLDCIGSAFNAKGLMQCPNCRTTENGNWLYASGLNPVPDLNVNDWLHNELHNFNVIEMPYGFQWCPFDRLASVSSSVEVGETPPAISFHELVGHRAVLPEHPSNAPATHPCPYITYFHTLHPSSSSIGSQVQTEGIFEGPAPSPVFHGAEHTSVPPTTVAANPSVFLPGLPSGTSAPATTPAIHPHVRNSLRSRFRELQPHIQNGILNAHELWRLSNMGLAAANAAILSQLPHHGAFHFTQASSIATHESDGRARNQFYPLDRDRQSHFHFIPVSRASQWWALPPLQSNGASDQSRQAAMWAWHASEASSSQHQPGHAPQMHPFI